jgi:hypothetical protein
MEHVPDKKLVVTDFANVAFFRVRATRVFSLFILAFNAVGQRAKLAVLDLLVRFIGDGTAATHVAGE